MLDAPLGAARTQVHENYIISQTREGVVILDQHAPHERLVYERMEAQPAAEGVVVVRYTPEPALGEALLRGRFRYIAEPFELRFSKSGKPTIEMIAK